MPQPSFIIPARITDPAASSPASQPSDLAASAASRPIPADLSSASALKSPPFALRAGGVTAGRFAGRRPGLAYLLAHLRDPLADRRKLRVPGDLPAYLLHLARRQLPANGAPPPGIPGPQEPRPMSGMTRLGTRAVRLPAPAPVLAHRPAAEIAHRRQLRIQPVPLSFQPRKRWPGHGHSPPGG